MGWHKLIWVVPETEVGPLSDCLESLGAASIACEAATAEHRFHEPGVETALWQQNAVEALFPESEEVAPVLAAVAQAGQGRWPEATVEFLEDADWGRVWMERYQPMRFGQQLWVVPSWLEPPDPAAVNLILDPGMAFGTGTHATTALCLGWLADHAPLAGLHVLDYGAGSGILAIAALRLGAASVWAVDIDPDANRVAAENAERNGVRDRLHIGLPGQLPPTTFDLLLANILLEPLLGLRDRFHALLKPTGQLVMSGLLEEQTALLEPHYQAGGWCLDPAECQDGWAMLSARPC